MLHRLQYISQGNSPEEHFKNIQSALDAGVKLVQLRLKNLDDNSYSDSALQIKALCNNYKAQLIINDNATVAKHCDADAVHLGLDDMKVEEAKKILKKTIIGGTANTFDHIQQRHNEGVHYIGLGPYRFTTTKEKLSPVLGREGYTRIIQQMKAENIRIPVFAIGGIVLEDVKDIMSTGVYGIAVSGLITRAPDKAKMVKELHKILYHVKNSG
ncbi:MAG: thiamine phosphate synthase [Bacteroidetes bacterium]|nr:thiamine phosphate synthase [Bacteroidota bacterium]